MVTRTARQYPWELVGPWYRTESLGGPKAVRATAPIFQKYAAADFANRIIKEPQESLQFNGEDFATRICLDPDRVVTSDMRGPDHEPLKFFLDVHNRFYVVVCELHCVAPGFPSVDREQVCEAGFVVRRRVVPNLTNSAREALTRIIRERHSLKSQLLKISGGQSSSPGQTTANIGNSVIDAFDEVVGEFQKNRRIGLLQKLEENRSELETLRLKYDLSLILQGWQPGEHDGVGAWVVVEDSPATLAEYVYPLYPLIADPNNTAHSASGKTMWFGVVPTASSMVDRLGNPIFNEDDLYEVRCFVRRHNPACPKRLNESDCSGHVVWSNSTESYRLASFYDLDGGHHKPINIRLPDLGVLKSQADLGPLGRGANLRMISPPESTLDFGTNEMDMPDPGASSVRPGQQICFSAIFPLFIVAMFLFKLFLPIVMFLFQLWFLLKLRFCIPPTITFGADIAVDLAVDIEENGPELEARLDQGVEIDGEIYTNVGDLKDLVAARISDETGAEGSFRDEIENALQDSLSLDELADLYIAMKTDFSDDPEHEVLAGSLPSPISGLFYFEKVNST